MIQKHLFRLRNVYLNQPLRYTNYLVQKFTYTLIWMSSRLLQELTPEQMQDLAIPLSSHLTLRRFMYLIRKLSRLLPTSNKKDESFYKRGAVGIPFFTIS